MRAAPRSSMVPSSRACAHGSGRRMRCDASRLSRATTVNVTPSRGRRAAPDAAGSHSTGRQEGHSSWFLPRLAVVGTPSRPRRLAESSNDVDPAEAPEQQPGIDVRRNPAHHPVEWRRPP